MAVKKGKTKKEQILELIGEGKRPVEIAKKLDTAERYVRHVIQLAGLSSSGVPDMSQQTDGKGLRLELSSEFIRKNRIVTVDQAVELSGVDLEKWEMDRFLWNKWEVGAKDVHSEIQIHPLIQVKIWFKARIVQPFHVALDAITQKLLDGKFKHPTPPKKKTKALHMLEVSLFDHHFGRLAWSPETNTSYDLKIARLLYYAAVDDLLQRAQGFEIGQTLFPVGQDFFHVNSQALTTQKGTPQDVDTRLAKIFEAGCEAVIHAVDRCLEVAPVKVIWVPGNHDPETSYYLALYLRAWYRNSKHVNVDALPTTRKYVRYGVNLIGFTHGDEEPVRDLPAIMAAEEAEAWAQTIQREWHIGHVHKKKETRFLAGDTFGGVGVRILPSLSAIDQWHYKKGYVGTRQSSEAYLWSFQEGYIGHFATYAKS